MSVASMAPRGASHHSTADTNPWAPVLPALSTLDLQDRSEIPHLLERIDLRKLYPGMSGSAIKVPCPFHQDIRNPSLGVFRANVYCFTCHKSVGALEAIQVLCHTRTRAEQFAIARYLLGEVVKVAEPVLSAVDEAAYRPYRQRLERKIGGRAWLQQKYGLTTEAQLKLDLGHAGSAYTIPVRDLEGKLQNIRFRRDPQEWPDLVPPQDPTVPFLQRPRYWGMEKRNTPLWYFPVPVRGRTIAQAMGAFYRKTTIILTEGELDAGVLAAQLNLPALSITNGCGAWKHPDLKLSDLAGCTVWVMYDADEAGQSNGQELTSTLQTLGITARTVQLPPGQGKDPSELVVKGWTREQFLALLQPSSIRH